MNELFEHPDTDGLWLAASCTVSDPPEWLKRGTGASVSFIDLHRQSIDGWERVLRGIVREVFVLSPSVEPAEPQARVCWLGEESPDRAATGEVIYGRPGERDRPPRHRSGSRCALTRMSPNPIIDVSHGSLWVPRLRIGGCPNPDLLLVLVRQRGRAARWPRVAHVGHIAWWPRSPDDWGRPPHAPLRTGDCLGGGGIGSTQPLRRAALGRRLLQRVRVVYAWLTDLSGGRACSLSGIRTRSLDHSPPETLALTFSPHVARLKTIPPDEALTDLTEIRACSRCSLRFTATAETRSSARAAKPAARPSCERE